MESNIYKTPEANLVTNLENSSGKKAGAWSFIWRCMVFFFVMAYAVGYAFNGLFPLTETIIKWKPTITSLAMALVFMVLAVLYRRKSIQPFLSGKLEIKNEQWYFLNILMMALFVSLSVLNLVVAFNFSTETWISYKLYSGLAVLGAIIIMGKIASTRVNKPNK